jgi:hypothetical protein
MLSDLHPVFYTGKQSPTQKEAAKAAFVEGRAKVLIMSLRSGSGLDGLQGVARTAVVGELDWSPAVHDQFGGRLHRDGQAWSVVLYFMMCNVGSDPVIADALGLKASQLKGVTDPDAALVTKVDRGGAHIKRLAADFLKRHTNAKKRTPPPAAREPVAPTQENLW